VKLVVTGALGHIGSRFIHGLRSGMWSEVLLIDNLATQRMASLFNLPADVPFHFVGEDILTSDLPARFKDAHAVVHLAALTDPAASFDDPEGVAAVNGEGTARVARACVKTGARLLFPSSTSVYAPRGATVDENCPDADLDPKSPYAADKLGSEKLLRAMGGDGLRFACCRFGTIFGPSPGMRFHTAVNRFVWQACLRQPLTVWRTALNQRRPYVDVEDAARAIEFLLREDLFSGETYNVLTANATVQEVLDILRVHVPDFEVELVEARAMNDLSYTVSADKLSRAGFEPAGSLERGIRETVTLLRGAGGFSRGFAR
jgi:UDP-glucose 4-epimerase